MKERPIIFTGDSVCAILEGTKTQTRRPVRFRKPFEDPASWGYCAPHPVRGWVFVDRAPSPAMWAAMCSVREGLPCPYGEPGDRLWVKETWAYDPDWEGDGVVHYRATHRADATVQGGHWKSARYMPRWAARITLTITGLRVERLREITEADLAAEGFELPTAHDVEDAGAAQRGAFMGAWERINSRRAPWSTNPWVWVVQFALAGVRHLGRPACQRCGT